MASLAPSAPDADPPYHWTPQLQRAFLEALAESGSIGQAVAACGRTLLAPSRHEGG